MNKTITEIKKYILFLKKTFSLDITLHPYQNEHLISTSELILFNIHENSHCVYVKTFPEAHEHCINRQKKIFEKCANGSFFGTCYAGVYEYIHPFYNKESLAGFISVSGYKLQDYNSFIERCSSNYNIPLNNLQKTASSLKENVPSKDFVDTLIFPLVRMIELAYIKTSSPQSNNNIIHDIIKYVNRHYAENITLNQICGIFSCSRSNISHKFKKETKQSFRDYLILFRLQAAKSLLSNSQLTITEIAYSVGFSDSNYFSVIFKKHIGVSPRAFRKQNL